MADSEEALWRRVFELAEKGRYSTSPNPRVGAVLVSPEGEIVGEGFHERAGDPHAEVHCLEQAGEKARGATLYINIEPCAHFGRTPPCVDALIEAGIGRVVASLEDPDPRTSGKGFRKLEEAGIEVDTGSHANEARRLNEEFIVSVRHQRPHVLLKWGASLDGKIATRFGHSHWITSEEARGDSMKLREQCDAILVGAGTILADDPQLTRRLGRNTSIIPHRKIVVDARLRVDPAALVFSPDVPGEAWLVTSKPEEDPDLVPFRERGVNVLSLPDGPTRVDLKALLSYLHRLEVRSLLVEGGGTTAWNFLDAGLVDRVVAYIAPILIGGETAPGPIRGDGVPELKLARRLMGLEVSTIGPDVRISGRIA
ncbi:MAG: bifunctional diaminohydroxyphosphoribosylaminopyrimidine deaminase/5-amino-6-(5-phosphoribosylamino)uracil reductase RibD [Acidobacteria bacterium]|nr:bifunctional diaminohydroxyphosphoribosylaminopyrimidine deaminase/5-amino-6-(5-phosphoribosylamino)uracil reductase RibD [Acidobacteriota bacterium]MCG3195470.1 Riboflavin biosynthesis protein RibD [Thermoanaerobaculia bacterium]MCK6682586.1 bifunctional diaminohydroxyphosphoribosylaminopyrimidine deaminase/5-amino-6-(5-phosphoribosylamino)uracil reductase RibD [Thermoanaerobaculia bacterium]